MTDILDPRLTPARADIADERLRGRVEAARFVAGSPRRVTAPSAPLRREPSPGGGLDTEALLGDAVTLYAEADGFAFVQLARDGYVGYLPADSLGPEGPEPTHRVTALRTFLYPEPDLKRPVRAHLSLGARLVATGESGAYLETPDGYVFTRHCAPVAEREPDYVATAARLVGIPYLWGGRTTLGLDCSGLAQLCLDAAGLPCPRDADMQERALGRALPLDVAGLRRGDFVFWRGHMGLMLDAETLIHANGHHMAVAVEPLAGAVERIQAHSYGAVTSLRRL
ncbi:MULTISPECIES: C40 family peptidase [unclassified Methylobacterium]|jgi:cell wall-associated NlpC family hydrolase|uniref:C40 family peptidase n=1 Tax=unclassified Methylobacterium TaxID=2615210 RepID=UPI001354B5CF|nr:NlpC/P60 family protein [Methylobacterium sp. 2A]MWV23396.1 NlpC/P60 family protein [Methylobacterium sp. 2A]